MRPLAYGPDQESERVGGRVGACRDVSASAVSDLTKRQGIFSSVLLLLGGLEQLCE